MPSYAEKYSAERAVQRVKGVRGLAEEIEVRLVSTDQTDDDQLAKRVADVFAWDAVVPAGAVMVKVQDGCVTLTGEVDWDYQRRSCESLVRKLSGVRAVFNQINLKSRVQASDLRETVDKALQRSAEIEAQGIRLQVQGGTVTVGGKVHSWSEREAVQRAVWSVAGVTAVVNHLSVG